LCEPSSSCLEVSVRWCSHPVVYDAANDNDRSDKNIEKGCHQKGLAKDCNVIIPLNAQLCVISCHHWLFDCIPRWVNVASLEGITRILEAWEHVTGKKQTPRGLGKELEQWNREKSEKSKEIRN